MPLFEVTFSDGSKSVMQAHSKKQLRAALQNVEWTSAEKKPTCRICKKAVATLQGLLCQPCYDTWAAECRKKWKDVPMSEEDFQNTALSYFVGW